VAGRASIVGAAATHVGNVRDHNEDAHFIDVDLGVFVVCDGMGGHAAGEVASDLAIRALRERWASDAVQRAADHWLERGTPEAKKQLLDVVRAGVVAAHDSILAEADRDESKSGMGTTLVGAVIVGGELVFAHAGDSRAYLVRDGISMQLTEDHTLLARLLAAGIDVDVTGEGSRFRSMLTNALGIGEEVKVSTFVVPLADGDRFLLCSDGISEYVPEHEVGDVLTKQSSPARAAQRLIDLALERGGGDNATAVVVRVLEAGETPLPAEQRKKDDAAVSACALWGKKVTPQQRLRALRIAIPRDHNFGEKLPPHALGDRVAWIVLEGEVVQDGESRGAGALIYPESLLGVRQTLPAPSRDALAITRSDVRALAIRANDFRELCEDDGDLGEALLDSLAAMVATRRARTEHDGEAPVDPRGATDPNLPTLPRRDAHERNDATVPGGEPFERVELDDDGELQPETLPDEPTEPTAPRRRPVESSMIAPAAARAEPAPARRVAPPPPGGQRSSAPPAAPAPSGRSASQPPARPSPPPAPVTARAASQPPARPSPLPSPLTARPAGPPPPPARDAARPARSSTPPPLPPSVRAASPAPSRTPPPQAQLRTVTPPDAPSGASAPPKAMSGALRAPATVPRATVGRAEPATDPAVAAVSDSSVTRPLSAVIPGPRPGSASRAEPATEPAVAAVSESSVTRPLSTALITGSRASAVSRAEPATDPAVVAVSESSVTRPLAAAVLGASAASAPGLRDPARAGAATVVGRLHRSPPNAVPEPVRDDGGPSDPEIEPVIEVIEPATETGLDAAVETEAETYLEIEAELPPENGGDPDLESELALNIALSGDLAHEPDSVSITIDKDGRRVIETTTETETHTLTVTVTEPLDQEIRHELRTRAITADDAVEVSGSISIPEETPPLPPPPSSRRRIRGWGD